MENKKGTSANKQNIQQVCYSVNQIYIQGDIPENVINDAIDLDMQQMQAMTTLFQSEYNIYQI